MREYHVFEIVRSFMRVFDGRCMRIEVRMWGGM